MNRIIKFRAWDGEQMWFWSLGDEIALNEVGARDATPNSKEVMQFTGLTDKNGKEIYEGDILAAERGGNHEVVWEKRFACFTFFSIEPEAEARQAWYPNEKLDWVKVEVIGNIYENPKLLSEGKEKV